MKKVDFEVIKHYGTISEDGTYEKEVNLIRWNGMMPKLDIRQWIHGDKPGKGITLSMEELARLKEIIEDISF